MKIKSLLLGSAATMVAVSGAQAADAIIVEPEPVEYVRVCDMYGAGFFYIPGTETCLSIRGQVRIDYSVNMFHDADSELSDHEASVSRARLFFTANNETEMGTLGSQIVLTSTASEYNSGEGVHDAFSAAEVNAAPTGLSKATINIAGFRMGYDAVGFSAWNRYGGYGYYGSGANDGIYAITGALFLEYGGSAGDMGYVVGIQDTAPSGASGQPDLYAGMTYNAGGLSLAAVVNYDTSAEGVAYKIRADYDLSSFMPRASIGAWYENDGGDTDYIKGHIWGVTMTAGIGEKFDIYAGYSEYDAAPADTATRFDYRDWTIGLGWNMVPGLRAQVEWNKKQADSAAYGPVGALENSQDTFNMRVVRSF